MAKATKKEVEEKEIAVEENDTDTADKKKKEQAQSTLITESVDPPGPGDLVEGTVLSILPGKVFVDLHPFGTGIIYGREYLNARDVLRKVNLGDTIAAKVVDPENKDGYLELSLKEARQALIWTEADEALKSKQVFELPIKDANKGGLIIEWQGITGFLPASQLRAEHYPHIEDGDKDKILSELRSLVGKRLAVSIITADAREGKLIFSEKTSGGSAPEKAKMADRYAVGDVIEGSVTGIVDFGVFVRIEDSLEGLVHISEIDWGLVSDPRKFVKVGDTVKAKIIEIKDGKISLSLKALKENPWKAAAAKYKKGDIVSAVIIKYNKHGALASIEEGVAGLVHISEFEGEDKLRAALQLGSSYPFKITIFEPTEQRMTLSFSGAKEEK